MGLLNMKQQVRRARGVSVKVGTLRSGGSAAEAGFSSRFEILTEPRQGPFEPGETWSRLKVCSDCDKIIQQLCYARDDGTADCSPTCQHACAHTSFSAMEIL